MRMLKHKELRPSWPWETVGIDACRLTRSPLLSWGSPFFVTASCQSRSFTSFIRPLAVFGALSPLTAFSTSSAIDQFALDPRCKAGCRDLLRDTCSVESQKAGCLIMSCLLRH
ncbi:hypothetical protein BD311DRAFT_748887 [Dichomitus squalens]|uniref:Uncharacterized protein n=1 Tax=Dichomitus squalens TaxID=114155 RepID=A0A4Q9N3J2_9APHY|nr:hypothetical protein BD311DRAFT_748887 [Dichomitus squalens]